MRGVEWAIDLTNASREDGDEAHFASPLNPAWNDGIRFSIDHRKRYNDHRIQQDESVRLALGQAARNEVQVPLEIAAVALPWVADRPKRL